MWDVTIDNLKKTNTGGTTWKVEWSGTFKKLTNIDGTYHKWDKASFKVEQPGKSGTVNQVSLIPPTFTADGSYSVYAIIDETMDANWIAYAAGRIYTNAKDTFEIQPNQPFKLP